MEITTEEHAEQLDRPAKSGLCPCASDPTANCEPRDIALEESAEPVLPVENRPGPETGPPPLSADDPNWYCWSLTTRDELEPVAVVQWGSMREQYAPLQLEQLGLQLLRVAEQARHTAAIHRLLAVTGASPGDADEFSNAVAELRHELMIDHAQAVTAMTTGPAGPPDVAIDPSA
ncbi:hypothetical protein ACIBG8_54320 [Nonomuraea sp. NPDC050556]|uniref:hypothetical protein n=1 Tax=Nonomuraea sp. NPDC050556 TaxID=3364369 RepID=UPI00378826D8